MGLIFGTTLSPDDLAYCRCLHPVHESWDSCPNCGNAIRPVMFEDPDPYGDGLGG